MRTLLPGILLLALGLIAPPGHAKPFVPADDTVVVEQLPDVADPVLREFRRVRAAVAARPDDPTLAIAAARRLSERARATGDPRYLGQAEALLGRWWNDAEPPTAVLVMRASIRQSQHEFDAALADLTRVITRDSANVQARLTRATVQFVRGDYVASRDDCAALVGRVHDAIRLACVAPVRAALGEVAAAYTQLSDAARAPGTRFPGSIASWIETLLAELAVQSGDHARARAHFVAALGADPRDPYTLAAYADFLLERGEAGVVLDLLNAFERHDGLVLRRVLALKANRDRTFDFRAGELRQRFREARARGDALHLREEARFHLEVDGNASLALTAARENWAVQREPADLRLLVAAAQRAGDRRVLDEARRWVLQAKIDQAGVVPQLAARQGADR